MIQAWIDAVAEFMAECIAGESGRLVQAIQPRLIGRRILGIRLLDNRVMFLLDGLPTIRGYLLLPCQADRNQKRDADSNRNSDVSSFRASSNACVSDSINSAEGTSSPCLSGPTESMAAGRQRSGRDSCCRGNEWQFFMPPRGFRL